MAPKSAPFRIVVHYTGKKSEKEMQSLYADFYIHQIKSALESSGLQEDGKREVIDRLLDHLGRTVPDT